MGQPTLICPTGPSDTGAYRLEWKAPQGVSFRLQENGELLYLGPQRATTVSGRPRGSFTYRVGVVKGEAAAVWSDSCTVHVRPPTLGFALTLFGIGLGVFLATVLVIVRGHRAHRRGENLP